MIGLISQMRRTAISIPANIAEGSGKKSQKEYLHFLQTALSSAIELDYKQILVVEAKDTISVSSVIHNSECFL